MSSSSSVVTGQVTYRRPVSKRLVFYDVLIPTTQGSSSWQEVVVKQDVYGSVQDIRNLRDTLKLGDVATFTGSYEQPPRHGFLAEGCAVVGRWADANPGVAFTPQPAPLPPTAAAQQQDSSSSAGTTGQQDRKAAEGQQQEQEYQGHASSVAGTPASACGTTDVSAAAAEAAAEGLSAAPTATEVTAAVSVAAAAREPPATLPATATGPPAPAPAAGGAGAEPPPPAGLARGQTAAAAAAAAPPPPGAQPPRLQVCKFWVNSGRCAKGASCPYAHTSLLTARRSWQQARQSQRVAAAASLGFQHPQGAASKHHRAQLFCSWLVGSYGVEWLNSGAGVVDVAGGRGAVSYELQVKHGVKVTLVDPRPFKLSREQVKELQQLGCQQPAVHVLRAEQLQSPVCSWGECSVMPAVAVQSSMQNEGATPMNDAAATADGEDANSASSSSSSPDADTPQLPSQAAVLFDSKAQGISQDLGIFRQVVGLFDQDLWSTPGWQQLLGGCSLVLGMHPDQATEGILEYSLQESKAFAIVPCCVFPRQYSHRRYRKEDGSTAPVVAYAELVQYLLQRGAAAGGQGGGAPCPADHQGASAAAAQVKETGGEGGAAAAAAAAAAEAKGGAAADAAAAPPPPLPPPPTAAEAPPPPIAAAGGGGGGGLGTAPHSLGAARVQVLAFEGANQVVYRPLH